MYVILVVPTKDEYHRQQLVLKQVQQGLKHFNKDYTNTQFEPITQSPTILPTMLRRETCLHVKPIIGWI